MKTFGDTSAHSAEFVVPSLNCVGGSWAVMIEVVSQVEVTFHPGLRHIVPKARYRSGVVVVVI